MVDILDILAIDGNEEALTRLIPHIREKKAIPFIGAGFSTPSCPCWGDFLEKYYRNVKSSLFTDEKIAEYERYRLAGDFEKMADLLVTQSTRLNFETQLQFFFNRGIQAGMEKKFHLLHHLFPGLKITTNFDRLIEISAPAGNPVSVCMGYQSQEMEYAFSASHGNVLLKIHGSLDFIKSIVLTGEQYGKLYGAKTTFKKTALLPVFLQRVFSNAHLIFIGCSLVRDRIYMVLTGTENSREHFAIMKRPEDRNQRVLLTHNMNKAAITPLWITGFDQVELLLEWLEQEGGVAPDYVFQRPFEPGGVTFVGREKELEKIKNCFNVSLPVGGGSGGIIVLTGAGGVGKTTLALQAALLFKKDFPDGVYHFSSVDEYSPMMIAQMLARRLHVPADEPPDAVAAQALVSRLLAERSCLLILDNAGDWLRFRYVLPQKTTSVLIVTTRNRQLFQCIRLLYHRLPLEVRELHLEMFSGAEALKLFRAMLGPAYREGEERDYLAIAEKLGFLPIALRLAITRMVFSPRHSAATLLERLRGDKRLNVLRAGEIAAPDDCRSIEAVYDLSSPLIDEKMAAALDFLAVCAPGPAPLDFLQRLSGDADIGDTLEYVYNYSWCDCQEKDHQRWYELHQLVRDIVRRRLAPRYADQFFEVVHKAFTDDEVHYNTKDLWYPQLEEALVYATERKDPRIIDWMHDLYRFSVYRGFRDFLLRVTEAVERLFPDNLPEIGNAFKFRALIFKKTGKTTEAWELLKAEEKIREMLGDKLGMAGSLGNQALILSDWGRLEEGMALHKREEQLYHSLGYQKGLGRSYANQALIMTDWGLLKEALALHKKNEKIKIALGDKEGVAKTYGNQALILKLWGRLPEALALFRKEEHVYVELGDKAGLARTYGNQANIYYLQGLFDEAMKLHDKEDAQCQTLNDSAGLAACYGNKALILRDRGLLDEALALHLKEENLYDSLHDQFGLACSYINQGVIFTRKKEWDIAASYFRRGDKISESLNARLLMVESYWEQGRLHQMKYEYEVQRQLWEKSIEMKKEMGIPTEKCEKELKDLLIFLNADKN